MTKRQQKSYRMWSEEIEIAASDLFDRVNDLVKEGNIRRLVIRKPSGEILLEVPLTAGVVVGGVVTLFYPVLAALTAMAALLSHVKVEIIRCEPAEKESCERE